MPSLNATTTAVFNSIGVDATSVYNTMVSLIGTAVSFGLFLIQVSWPFILGLGFLYLLWRLASRFISFGR